MKKLTEILKLISSIVAVLAIVMAISKPHIEEFIDERIEQQVISPVVLGKAMNSPFMLDYKQDQKREWEQIELNKEDSKLKFSYSLVNKTGMNKDAMSDTLASMIKQHCLNRRYVTEEECIKNTKKYCKARERHTMLRN